MNEVLKAQEMLAERNVAADVWSITSYKAQPFQGVEFFGNVEPP